MGEWACVLCAAGGRESGPRHNNRSVICADHVATLKAQGRVWCNRGRHVVTADDYLPTMYLCKACNRARNAPKQAYYTAARSEEARQRARERELARYHRHRREDIEAFRAKRRESRRRNAERVREARRRHQERHAERLRERARRWREQNRERLPELRRVWKARQVLKILRGAPRAR